MPTRDRFAWLLTAATAFAAMVAGHALELWLENVHAFGGHPAQYVHVAQSFTIDAALALLLAVAVIAVRRLTLYVTSSHGQHDCFLPALQGVAHAGLARVAIQLVAIQIAALTFVELCEQRLSGFQGNGLLSIFGTGHATTLPVHVIIGLLAALLLYCFARYASAQSKALVNVVAAFLRRAKHQLADDLERAKRPAYVVSFGGKCCLIALGFANRPPPAAIA